MKNKLTSSSSTSTLEVVLVVELMGCGFL
jgi:hypothetical protein